MTSVELRPSRLSEAELREYIADEIAGGWGPDHFMPAGYDAPVCETHGDTLAGEVYKFTADRGIWEEWYAVGWGCQACAEILHA